MQSKNRISVFEFSPTEIKESDDIGQKIHSEVVEIAKDLFCVKGWLLPSKAFDVNAVFSEHGIKELKTFVGGGGPFSKSIIDVGACTGESALIFSQYTDKKVYSFEPSPANFEMLKKTINLNNLADKIIPINKGLGDKKEVIKIRTDIGGGGFNLYANTDKEGESIEIDTLDNFVEENNIEVGLIKVDIEGMEQKFLAGAINTIKKQKPVLLLSIYHNANDFFEIKPMIENWNLGYKFKIRKLSVKEYFHIETMLICEV
jgi:FkbM family methyltransferase